MRINSIKLTNFRNWTDYSLDFKDVTILIGKNGVGKTNLMEAVWFLSTGKSWRTNKDSEAVNWESDLALIEGKIKGVKDTKINLAIQRNPTKERPSPKILKINNSKKRLLDLLGHLPGVLFSPESLQILDGAPGLRRRFLDILLSQMNHKYALALLEFNKVLKERNKLLFHLKHRRAKPDPSRSRQEADELDFWDDKLVELSGKIIKERQAAIKFMNQKLTDIYQEISGTKETLKLVYKASVEPDNMAQLLVAVREREIEQTSTLYGPHRDDFVILLDKRDITTFGSRGEYRSALLALKISELNYLRDKIDDEPILLLDDIFSELDADRRMHLAKIVLGQQTVITTTDLGHIEKNLREKAKIVEIE